LVFSSLTLLLLLHPRTLFLLSSYILLNREIMHKAERRHWEMIWRRGRGGFVVDERKREICFFSLTLLRFNAKESTGGPQQFVLS
jgi:hypothetical protein